MKKGYLFLAASVIAGLLILVSGCGQTNALAWTKSSSGSGASSVSALDQARGYIDSAEYKKAISILDDYLKNHGSDKDANILYAEGQLGLADIDMASAINAIGSSTPTQSIEKLNNVCSSSERYRVYDAALRFINYPPTKSSDKVIAALCGLIAYTSIIHDTFDPANNGLSIDSGTDLLPSAAAGARWTSMGGKQDSYMNLASTNLASLSGNKNLQDATSSMNSTLTIIDAGIGALNWGQLKTILLSF